MLIEMPSYQLIIENNSNDWNLAAFYDYNLNGESERVLIGSLFNST